jgi:hypothetical protein
LPQSAAAPEAEAAALATDANPPDAGSLSADDVSALEDLVIQRKLDPMA